MDRLAQLRLLKDIAFEINSGQDLGAVLADLVSAACRRTEWSLSAIMAIDVEKGFAEVVTRYDPAVIRRKLRDRWELASSPALVALRRNEPVFIRDAHDATEYDGYHKEAVERDYRTVLILPMGVSDVQDRPMVLSVCSRKVRDVTEEDLAYLGLIIQLAAAAVDREHRLLAERASVARLNTALMTQGALLNRVLNDDSVDGLAQMVGDLLPHPTIIVDFTMKLVAARRSPLPGRYDDPAWRRAARDDFAEALIRTAQEAASDGVHKERTVHLGEGAARFPLRLRIEPLRVDGELVGALLLCTGAEAFDELDQIMLDSARFALNVQMMRSFIRFRFETRGRAELFREVVERRWQDATDIEMRARHLGLNFARPVAMLRVEMPPGRAGGASDTTDRHHSLLRILRRAGLEAPVIALGEVLVALIPAPEGEGPAIPPTLPGQVVAEFRLYFERDPLVLQGEVCRALDDYGAAWRQMSRMSEIARSLGRSGVIVDRDFGPLPMLVAAAGMDDVRSFVLQRVGRIVDYDRTHNTPYLETLREYLRAGCRSQACADAMALHVTTLRYRLGRIEDLFGLRLDTAEARFTIELAVRLHEVMAAD